MSENTICIGFQNNDLWLKEIDTESLFKDFVHFRGRNPKNSRLRRAFPLFFNPEKTTNEDDPPLKISVPNKGGGGIIIGGLFLSGIPLIV